MVTILYFAWLREKTGFGEETLALPGTATVRGLVAELRRRGGAYEDAFGDEDRLRAAVNQVHVDFDHVLRDGDEVAFFPPVTGG